MVAEARAVGWAEAAQMSRNTVINLNSEQGSARNVILNDSVGRILKELDYGGTRATAYLPL